MIVIDASSLAKYILREDNWKKVREYLFNDPCSITLILAEVSNAIWKQRVIRQEISAEEATVMLDALREIHSNILFLEPLENYLEEALRISMSEKITVYDSLYIAQAKKYGELITSDNKQGFIAKKMNINVKIIV